MNTRAFMGPARQFGLPGAYGGAREDGQVLPSVYRNCGQYPLAGRFVGGGGLEWQALSPSRCSWPWSASAEDISAGAIRTGTSSSRSSPASSSASLVDSKRAADAQ